MSSAADNVIASRGISPAESTAGSYKSSYSQILKSSAVIGGSSVFNIAIGIVRTKLMALILGPAGVGLLGLYGSIVDLTKTIAGMGTSTSGVRLVAEALGAADEVQLSQSVLALRRTVLALAIAGAALLAALCSPVAYISFGDREHTMSVALLALAVLFSTVSTGQLTLLQGMRRIGDLARANVLAPLFGLLVAVPIVYFEGRDGVVPALVGVATVGTVVGWWYSRKVYARVPGAHVSDLAPQILGLLKLGFVFMLTGFMSMGVAYLVRIIVLRKIGEEAAGFYQSAWTLGGLYVGFILQAMGADFFPRLTAVAKDNTACNRLVNEQAEVGLLLAGPGVLGTLTFAPVVIQAFYSARFGPAVEILRWISLGMLLRVVSWPLGFILLAKGVRKAYFWSELVSALAQVLLVWTCVTAFGLPGTGIAFFCGYICYAVLIYLIARRISAFRWTGYNKRTATAYIFIISVTFVAWYALPPLVFSVLGSTITLITGIHSLRRLCTLVPLTRLPRFVVRALERLRIKPQATVG